MNERAPTSLAQHRERLQNKKLGRPEESIQRTCGVPGCNIVLTESAGYGVCPFAHISWNGIYPARPTLELGRRYAKDFRARKEQPERAGCTLATLNQADLVQALLGIIRHYTEQKIRYLPRYEFGTMD